MSVSLRSILPGLTVLSALAAAAPPASREPGVFFWTVWPDRAIYFDEKTERLVGEFRLRHGAAVGEGRLPDRSRLYFITDRMEAVEVVDPARREVVDELKLSTPSRKVRFLGVSPDPSGKLLYLNARAVKLEIDRFTPEKPHVVVYDLDARQVKATFEIPEEIDLSGRGEIRVSPDGKSLFVFGRDIYQLSATDYKIIDKIVLSKPLLAGYGPLRGVHLEETEPGLYYGIYRTTDPFLKKSMFGVMRFEMRAKGLENFELGPDLKVGLFALSPDGKRGYAGLTDLVVVDMEARRVLKRKEGFEQGRANNSLIVSADGKKLYVSGVGDTVHVYDSSTLSRLKSIFAGGDFTSQPLVLPRSVLETRPRPSR